MKIQKTLHYCIKLQLKIITLFALKFGKFDGSSVDMET